MSWLIEPIETPCDHTRVEADDDGLDRHWHYCLDCHVEVMPDPDGGPGWVPVE